MSLATKTFLLVSDQAEVRDRVQLALKPLVKTVILAQSDKEARAKLDNQDFDAILLRNSKPTLDDPMCVFQWCKSSKKHSRIPWVVLGTDIESQTQVVNHANLKFIPDAKDGAALIKILEGVFFSPDSSKAAIDVNFINPFVSATIATLESMCQVKLVRGTPTMRKPQDGPSTKGDVSGVIGMNSERFLGSVALIFEEGLILKAFSNMMGTPTTDINDDVKDAVAEMTNIIFGHSKRDLNLAGHTIAPAIPSVITGKGHEIRHSIEGVCIVIPFNCDHGRLTIECMIRPVVTASR